MASEHYNHQNVDIPYDQFKEKTGYHCAKWLIQYCVDNKLSLPKEIFIHSMNTAGRINIASIFETYNKYRKELGL